MPVCGPPRPIPSTRSPRNRSSNTSSGSPRGWSSIRRQAEGFQELAHCVDVVLGREVDGPSPRLTSDVLLAGATTGVEAGLEVDVPLLPGARAGHVRERHHSLRTFAGFRAIAQVPSGARV